MEHDGEVGNQAGEVGKHVGNVYTFFTSPSFLDGQYPLVGTKSRGFQLQCQKCSCFRDLILTKFEAGLDCQLDAEVGWVRIRRWTSAGDSVRFVAGDASR